MAVLGDRVSGQAHESEDQHLPGTLLGKKGAFPNLLGQGSGDGKGHSGLDRGGTEENRTRGPAASIQGSIHLVFIGALDSHQPRISNNVRARGGPLTILGHTQWGLCRAWSLFSGRC